MTNEQKETLLGKLAREQYGKLLHMRIFKEGAKAILDNPSEFGLMPILDSMDHIEESDQNWSEVVDNLKSQLTKYRGALDRVLKLLHARRPHTPGLGAPINIIKEALKQEGEK